MTVYRRNPEVEEAPLQHELMLFNAASAQFYMLNETMAYVWRHCDRPLDSLVSGMSSDFEGAEKTTAAADVQQALSELLSLGLLLDAAEAAL